MPSSNPTTGLGVPCYVHVAGINVQNSGGLTGGPTNDPIGGSSSGYPQGQGSGPQTGAAGKNQPVAQYSLTLSLSGKTINGVEYNKSCGLVGSVVDVSGTSSRTPSTTSRTSFGKRISRIARTLGIVRMLARLDRTRITDRS